MSLINNKIFQITIKFFFVFSLLMIAFSIADALLRNFEIIEIPLTYHLVWLCVILIRTCVVGNFKKMEELFPNSISRNWKFYASYLCYFFRFNPS